MTGKPAGVAMRPAGMANPFSIAGRPAVQWQSPPRA
jgi:hypothetical protein